MLLYKYAAKYISYEIIVASRCFFGDSRAMNDNEKQAVKDKLKLPVKRDKNGALIPTPFTDKETQFIIDVMLKPRRDSNLKKFGGGIQKHWGKMSKKERADNE